MTSMLLYNSNSRAVEKEEFGTKIVVLYCYINDFRYGNLSLFASHF